MKELSHNLRNEKKWIKNISKNEELIEKIKQKRYSRDMDVVMF